jgi:hypothetical protein
MSAMTEKRWWCCNAPFGEHEPTCKEGMKQPAHPTATCDRCGAVLTWECYYRHECAGRAAKRD